jgi:hypothetical protein
MEPRRSWQRPIEGRGSAANGASNRMKSHPRLRYRLPAEMSPGARPWDRNRKEPDFDVGPSQVHLCRFRLAVFFSRGHSAITTVAIPPRGRNSPFTSAHAGRAHRTTSAST